MRNSLQSELLFVGAGLKPLKKKIVAWACGTAQGDSGTTGTTGTIPYLLLVMSHNGL